MVRLQLERMLVCHGGLRDGPDLPIDVAEIVDGIDVVGLQLDRPAHQLESPHGPALVVAHHAEGVPGPGGARRGRRGRRPAPGVPPCPPRGAPPPGAGRPRPGAARACSWSWLSWCRTCLY